MSSVVRDCETLVWLFRLFVQLRYSIMIFLLIVFPLIILQTSNFDVGIVG